MGMLDGRVVIISGGGNGQGRSHAVTLAQEGADVAVFDVAAQVDTVEYPMSTAADLDETVRLVEAAGGRCLAMTADVRRQAEVDTVVTRTIEAFGHVDTVIANAGIFSYGNSWDLTDEQWQTVLDVNLTGVWHTCKAAIPHMIAGERGGAIVVVSSISGMKGYPGQAHYCASKHGVIGLMRTLAYELAQHKIRVNAVVPSGTATLMTQNSYMEGYLDVAKAANCDIQNLLAVEMMDPAEISHTMKWLVSDDARFVTGSTIPVDAGHLTR